MNRSVALRGAAVIAAVYGYFLIFAQFAFVELLRADAARRAGASFLAPGMEEKVLLGMMAAAGIGAGFFVAWKGASAAWIRGGLVAGAIASALAPFAAGFPALAGVSMLTGAAIGLCTVSLATLIRGWCPTLPWLGLGTGVGYAVCNFPVVFGSAPAGQAWIASGFAIAGALAVPRAPSGEINGPVSDKVFPFVGAVLVLTALVWLDSAAFFIIQHTGDFKSATWGPGDLWRNALIHLSAALVAGWWLHRGGARVLPAVAWLLLALAAILVNHADLREACGWLYPAGVSLYSTALVAWPAWFSGATSRKSAGWRAAWIYAVAGWFGSANGIGMAQSLEQVPPAFIVTAGLAILLVMLAADFRKAWRQVLCVAFVSAAFFLPKEESNAGIGSSFERGKQVYLAEGCIHCHSQYVRPGTADVERWGPEDITLSSSRPVLIGNRRQGPDLSNVGARRSAAWLKQHFIDPQAFSPGTTMPSYAHLFEDGRGEDLVSYLRQSGEAHLVERMGQAANWIPPDVPSSGDGKALFALQCAVCHGPGGKGDSPIASDLAKPPANLVDGPFIWSAPGEDEALKISRIIKFGIAGTDMPGHETLTDSQITALRDHVLSLRKRSAE